MKKLIRMMPDVAIQVFNKCTDDSCNPEHMTNDHKEYQVRGSRLFTRVSVLLVV